MHLDCSHLTDLAVILVTVVGDSLKGEAARPVRVFMILAK